MSGSPQRQQTVPARSGLRSRYLSLLFDAALTARIASGTQSGSRKYRRAQRVTKVVANMFPAAFDRLVDNATVTTAFPIELEEMTVLGYGSCLTAFLTRTTGPVPMRLVVKVYRKSLGRPLDVVLETIRGRRASYETLLSWYQGCDVVLPTLFTVLHGPVLSVPAAAGVQPYVPGPHLDLFADLTAEQLLQRLAQNARLRAQFRRVVECTLEAAKGDSCVDLVGRDNLVLAEGLDGPRLALLDNGIVDYKAKRERAPYFLDLLQDRLDYLSGIYARTGS